MLSRHDISDEYWNRITPFVPGEAGGHDGFGFDKRVFVNAIIYIAATGIVRATGGVAANHTPVFRHSMY